MFFYISIKSKYPKELTDCGIVAPIRITYLCVYLCWIVYFRQIARIQPRLGLDHPLDDLFSDFKLLSLLILDQLSAEKIWLISIFRQKHYVVQINLTLLAMT